jgi:hypothetical protein
LPTHAAAVPAIGTVPKTTSSAALAPEFETAAKSINAMPAAKRRPFITVNAEFFM